MLTIKPGALIAGGEASTLGGARVRRAWADTECRVVVVSKYDRNARRRGAVEGENKWPLIINEEAAGSYSSARK